MIFYNPKNNLWQFLHCVCLASGLGRQGREDNSLKSRTIHFFLFLSTLCQFTKHPHTKNVWNIFVFHLISWHFFYCLQKNHLTDLQLCWAILNKTNITEKLFLLKESFLTFKAFWKPTHMKVVSFSFELCGGVDLVCHNPGNCLKKHHLDCFHLEKV